jgi:hypothetical protein
MCSPLPCQPADAAGPVHPSASLASLASPHPLTRRAPLGLLLPPLPPQLLVHGLPYWPDFVEIVRAVLADDG